MHWKAFLKAHRGEVLGKQYGPGLVGLLGVCLDWLFLCVAYGTVYEQTDHSLLLVLSHSLDTLIDSATTARLNAHLTPRSLSPASGYELADSPRDPNEYHSATPVFTHLRFCCWPAVRPFRVWIPPSDLQLHLLQTKPSKDYLVHWFSFTRLWKTQSSRLPLSKLRHGQALRV